MDITENKTTKNALMLSIKNYPQAVILKPGATIIATINDLVQDEYEASALNTDSINEFLSVLHDSLINYSEFFTSDNFTCESYSLEYFDEYVDTKLSKSCDRNRKIVGLRWSKLHEIAVQNENYADFTVFIDIVRKHLSNKTNDELEVFVIEVDCTIIDSGLCEKIKQLISLAKNTNTILIFTGLYFKYKPIMNLFDTTILIGCLGHRGEKIESYLAYRKELLDKVATKKTKKDLLKNEKVFVINDTNIDVVNINKNIANLKNTIFNNLVEGGIDMDNNNEVKVLDINGKPLTSTMRFGKVRHLLKNEQAKVVNKDPFTIQLLYDANSININDCITTDDSNHLKLKLSNNAEYVMSGTNIICAPNNNQNKLLNKFINQLKGFDCELIIISNTDELSGKITSVTDAMNIFESMQKELLNRLHELEYTDENGFTHTHTLNEIGKKPIVIIISDYTAYMQASNYKAIDTIKKAIDTLSRLGNCAGIYTIIATSNCSGAYISTSIANNTFNKLIVGPIDHNNNARELQYMFNCLPTPLKLNENQCIRSIDISDELNIEDF